MKLKDVSLSLRRILAMTIAAVVCLGSSGLHAAPTVLYATGFEPGQGYNASLDLEGQQGWIGTGADTDGDNGLFNGYFGGLGHLGFGQQAYVGFGPLVDGSDHLFVWRPINAHPLVSNLAIVKFSVAMMIVDSTTTDYDSFRWSVYNASGKDLFTIAFNNASLGISYMLEDSASFIPTGQSFANSALHALQVTMDFAQNKWSATLDGAALVTNVPITTANTPLTLGDIDAVWVYNVPGMPGDNFMLFDNYTVTAEPSPAPQPPRLTQLGRFGNQFLVRVTGEAGRSYAVEGNTNLANRSGWNFMQSVTAAPDGTALFLDSAASVPRRFYRARVVP